jgi:hypothetical protein
MSDMGWTQYVTDQESAEIGSALSDLTADLEWLAGEFPALAEQATALRAAIMALPGMTPDPWWNSPEMHASDEAEAREMYGS